MQVQASQSEYEGLRNDVEQARADEGSIYARTSHAKPQADSAWSFRREHCGARVLSPNFAAHFSDSTLCKPLLSIQFDCPFLQLLSQVIMSSAVARGRGGKFRKPKRGGRQACHYDEEMAFH